MEIENDAVACSIPRIDTHSAESEPIWAGSIATNGGTGERPLARSNSAASRRRRSASTGSCQRSRRFPRRSARSMRICERSGHREPTRRSITASCMRRRVCLARRDSRRVSPHARRHDSDATLRPAPPRRPAAPAYYTRRDGIVGPHGISPLRLAGARAGKALIALGFAPGGTVSILGFNRPEWVIFDPA